MNYTRAAEFYGFGSMAINMRRCGSTYPSSTAFYLRTFLNHRRLKGPFQDSLTARVDTLLFVRFLPFSNLNVNDELTPRPLGAEGTRDDGGTARVCLRFRAFPSAKFCSRTVFFFLCVCDATALRISFINSAMFMKTKARISGLKRPQETAEAASGASDLCS